jgi:Folliculin-interacting protein N-terminus
MLGRLLSTFSSSAYSSRNPAVLDSVTEEEHTSGLLFPDPRLLHRSSNSAHAFQTSFNSPNTSSAGGYDDRGGLDLDAIKDFRIIIAQNAIGDRDEPCILLDSRGAPNPSAQGLGLDPQVFDSLGGRHSRTSSLSKAASRRGSIQTTQSPLIDSGSLSQAASARKLPPSPMHAGAFSRARGRSSISSVVSTGEGILEPYHNRITPENSDTGLLNCIFGSSAFSYRGSSTKMHILSTDSEPEGSTALSPSPREVDTLATRNSSRNPLARTYSMGTQPNGGYFLDRHQDNKSSSRVTILITRMFSVNLPESRDSSVESPDIPSSFPTDALSDNGFPFPDPNRRRKAKEKKTPMYAVAITVQIPLAARNSARPMSRLSTHVSDGQKQMSFSLDSDPHWSSAFLDDRSSQYANLDDRLDLLVDRWDVITRTLTYLETLARQEILILLKKVDTQAANAPKPKKLPNMQRTNQTIIQLRPNVLAHNSKLKEELLLNAQRISAALRIPRVVLGQSRWGVWRDEARWIARLMADKEHGLFFLVLITSFLGNHTEWLNTLGPEWYRRRHQMQQKAQQDSEPTIANRTLIISDNKMVARRLIFILSAFLPAKNRVDYANSPLRPGTSTSTRPLSQSPPSFPLLRQESLRRRINRKARAQRFNAEDSGSRHQRSVSASSSETTHRAPEESDNVLQGEPAYSHNRRGSDVRSIRTVGLPINPNEARTRATTSTTTNDSAVPVPHFASRQQFPRDQLSSTRIDENDSYASAKLLQNLRRSETSSTNSEGNNPAAGTKWVGNIFSGLWSGRTDSFGDAEGMISARRSSLAQPPSERRRSEAPSEQSNKSRLSSNASATDVPSKPPSATETISIPGSSTSARDSLDQNALEISSNDHAKDSLLKLSVQGDDGIVDVDLPLRGFLSLSSSNDSTIASPKKARTSITSMDAGGSIHSSFSNINSNLRDGDGPTLHVAGWLKNFHEDFLLQAVRPYHGIEADVKRAMLAESHLHVSTAGVDGENVNVNDGWLEVASTLIADTRTFTVKRLRLLRRGVANYATNLTNTDATTPSPVTPRPAPDNPSSATHLAGFFSNGRPQKNSAAALADLVDPNDTEYKFVEEPVMDVDGTLVDAVERVLIQSGQSSLAHSRAPSPHRNSRFDERSSDDTASAHHAHFHAVEVPRNECRKTVLGALEEIARSVMEVHCRDDGDVDFVGGDDSTDKDGRRRNTIIQDNALREGVRKWLLDVEEAL